MLLIKDLKLFFIWPDISGGFNLLSAVGEYVRGVKRIFLQRLVSFRKGFLIYQEMLKCLIIFEDCFLFINDFTLYPFQISLFFLRIKVSSVDMC
jgi:hypothetical protein